MSEVYDRAKACHMALITCENDENFKDTLHEIWMGHRSTILGALFHKGNK